MNTSSAPAPAALKYLIGGRVQGVGFRPFVYRMAARHSLCGWVKNLSGQVEIFAQGDAAALEQFTTALIHSAPPLSEPHLLERNPAVAENMSGFSILPSGAAHADIHVPPDFFACDDCRKELYDPADRRYRYPFINCTQCGPRYTLIQKLPYDRPNTSMAGFALCPACLREYNDPADRRFHAEPVACPACGPQLQFIDKENHTDGTEASLAKCIAALRNGMIVAVKGIGGYHLMCDAADDSAVQRLRERKPRPHKPLALMFPVRGIDGLDAVREAASPTSQEQDLLRSPMRAIVLLSKKNAAAALSENLAPGLDEIGVMLPYSPLHHLLLDALGTPLAATSANISGEPVLTDNADVEQRLGHTADAFLHHNRPILRPTDDPVFRTIAGTPRPLRLGRGCAPLELALPFTLREPLLAVGGHIKNTIALAWENRVVVSPHIGELDTPRSLAVFEQLLADLQDLYGVRACTIACDAHPDYASTRWAERSGLPLTRVWHHHAHASALAGEFPEIQQWLVFAWDGTGLGEDGTLWGGEALLGRPGSWWRAASIRPFHLPGSERAGRDPWRSAAALCWEENLTWDALPEDSTILKQAWQRHLNCPQTSAVGRLFDAAAALTGLLQQASFEGQGPMLLEAIAAREVPPIPLPLRKNPAGIWQSDWAPLLPHLLDTKLPVPQRAGTFHASLARALADQALQLRAEHGVNTIGLCGGVFQNRVLSEAAMALLQLHDFDVRFGWRVPCNDAGLSYGQVIETGST